MKQYNFQHIKKLGLAIMGFEGSENIYNILTELGDILNYVVVGVQMKSYHGDIINQADVEIIDSLKKEGLVDKVLWIDTDSKKLARQQEAEKRNILMEDMESEGCTHSIVIDADEYYNKDSFIWALQKIDDNDFDITYCQYTNYYKDYKSFLIYPFPDGMYVPFVSKSSYRFKFDGTDFNKPSDPTRRVIRQKNHQGLFADSLYVFTWKELKMHHLSWCRVTPSTKLNSWSSKKLFPNHNTLADLAIYDFENYETENLDAVHLIFNTPGNKVKVMKAPQAYIAPARDISYYKPYYYTYKRIVVLNMSTTLENGLYQDLEYTCRHSWANVILNTNEHPNWSYWSVINTDGETRIDKATNTIYVNDGPEKSGKIELLTFRFMKALELLDANGVIYDYVVKTNTSTWLNVNYIDALLKRQISDHLLFGFQLCCAFWSTFNLYLKGNLTIFPKRSIEILREKKADTYRIDDLADDVLIGSILSMRLSEIGIPQNDRVRVLPCLNVYDAAIDMSIDPNQYAAIQVKTTGDRSRDSHKMHMIQPLAADKFDREFYQQDEVFQKIIDTKPLDVELMRYTRAEWIRDIKDEDKPDIVRNLQLTHYNSWEDMRLDIMQLKLSGGYDTTPLQSK